MKIYSARETHDRLYSGDEIALLDVREAGQFGEGHALFAIPAPYSQLELIIEALVPRVDVAVILIDDGDGISELAARRMQAIGYSDINILDGGMPAWSRAGYPVYKGVNVPSKTLGELAEAIWHPKKVNAEQLVAWGTEGRLFDLFDARPAEEYARMRIPGARCLPNGELAYRLDAIARDPNQPMVVTCAGRTRGIAGVIGLSIAGFEGAIYALENGTQGWALTGQLLERDNCVESFPEPDEAALEDTHRRASRIFSDYNIQTVTTGDIQNFFSDHSRTSYVFDVRSSVEATSDPVATAEHAPCGQIVQATDQWVGVRRSRIVLCCNTGLRSAIAAFWLKQLGYEPMVARIDDSLRGLRRPVRRAQQGPRCNKRIDATQALRQISHGNTLLVDLRGSMDYRSAHISGAVWCTRARIAALLSGHSNTDIVLISDDPSLAALAAIDCYEAGVAQVVEVDGGHAALIAAGAAVDTTQASPTDTEAIDYLFFVHDRHDGNLDASRRYLAWETGLIDQLDECERNEFQLLTPV